MSSATRLNLLRHLKAPASEAFRIVEEIERFPDFMENVTTVEVLSNDGKKKLAAWEMVIDEAPLNWIEEAVYDKKKLRVEFRSTEGVFDRFDGFWQGHAKPSGCTVELQLEYEVGLPEIEDIIGPILKKRLTANLELMLKCIEERAKTK